MDTNYVIVYPKVYTEYVNTGDNSLLEKNQVSIYDLKTGDEIVILGEGVERFAVIK